MATREINLISTQKIETGEDRMLKRFVYVWSPRILGIYCVVLSIVLGISFYFTSRITAVEKGIVTEQKSITQKEQDEGLYLLLKQKVAALSQIFENRNKYLDLFNFFNGFQTETITIVGLKLSENEKIELNIKASDTVSLDAFTQNLLTVSQDKFTTIDLESLYFDSETNSYFLVLTLAEASPKNL